MAETAVTIDFHNTLHILNAVKMIAKNQRKYKLFRKIAKLLFHSWWGETFQKQGARRGHPRWRPLNPKYARWKRVHGKATQPLILTGHLQGSPQILADHKTRLLWGTKVPYAGYHQAPTVSGRPPKREMVFITTRDKGELKLFVEKFIENVLRRVNKQP